MDLFAETAHRVSTNTASQVNQTIEQKTIDRLNRIGNDEEKINSQLRKLDSEWDIERAIEANASSLLLLSLGMGLAHSKNWLWISGTVAAFLLQHAIQGWCPPVPILRRLGFRTQREIDNERTILLGRVGRLPSKTDDVQNAISDLNR